MIYFVLAVAVMGQTEETVQNGALLQLTGEAAKVEFGGVLTLIHNSTEDELVCSGKIRASDVVIEGTATTVADLIGEVATLKEDMAAVKQFVGMMPPSAPPPLPIFVAGTQGTNACPPGSSKITTREVCEAAAAFAGTVFTNVYGGVWNKASSPTGCFSASNGEFVLNTHPIGVAHPNDTPYCVSSTA